MAAGDVKSALQSVNDAAYLDIQPGSGIEWVIHNIYHEDDISVEFYDGTNGIVFDTATGAGVYAFYAFHVINSRWIRVKNTAGSAKYIGYDGVQTSS